MRVYLGSDHAGFDLKVHLLAHLAGLGHEVIDVGPAAFDPTDDYPPYCIATAIRAVGDPGSVGLVLGGSGNGEQIAANKVPGCRAALAWSVGIARLAREHNDAQIAGIGARMHTAEEAAEIAAAFVATPFSGDQRHLRRIGTLADYERTGQAPPLPGASGAG